MSNALYDTGRQGFLDGSFNWAGASIKCMLVGSGYTPDLGTDQFVADVPSGQIIARSPALTTKSETAGVADADNVTFSAVAGADCIYLVIYEDTGDDTTARLIACIDTATGLPLTPAGGNVVVAWDTAANKIFKL